MYRIICLYAALLVSACRSKKEPIFRPSAPAATDKSADFSLLTFRDAATDSVWNLRGEAVLGINFDDEGSDFGNTGGPHNNMVMYDRYHPKDMVLGLLGEDTATVNARSSSSFRQTCARRWPSTAGSASAR